MSSVLYPLSHLSPAVIRALSPAEALALAQRAPAILRSLPSTTSASAVEAVVAATDSAEVWATYENLLLVCLRAGDMESARESLRRLVSRFGADVDRVKALEGLVREADADDKQAAEILNGYDAVLAEDDGNIAIHKRRAALLRSLGRIPEAVAALVALVDFSPTDAEAWAELADVYLSQGLYAQAAFALEEVLVLIPNAWNMHARLGEVQYMAAKTGEPAVQRRLTAESIKRFSRSIELCDDYLRGYYGLKLVTSYALANAAKWPKQNGSADDFALPDAATAQKLGQLATAKLSEIVRRSAAKEAHWSGYSASELAAARELLAQETTAVVR